VRILAVSHSAILDVNRPLWMELARRGHHVRLVVPSRWKNDYGTQPLRPEPLLDDAGGRLSLRVGRAAMTGHTAFQCYAPAVIARMAVWRPNVIFIDEEPWSLATLQWAALAALLDCPLAVWTMENRQRRYPWPFSLFNAFVLRRAGWIAAISDASMEVFRAQGYRGIVSVAPKVVDTGLFFPVPGDHKADEPRIGFVGRIAPEKGVETALDAMALLDGVRVPTLHVYGAGDATYLEELRQRQRRLCLGPDRVVWHGPVAHQEAPEAMRSLDLLVVPTVSHHGYKEQFGRVVIEALACKVPVLTSDNGELPVLVTRTGGGFIAPEGQPQALAEGITAALADRTALAQRAEEGYHYVLRHYTYGTLAEEVEGVLRRIVRDAAATHA